MSIEVSRNTTLRPSTSSFVVFLIFLGMPMVLAWFTIIHYGVTSGSSETVPLLDASWANVSFSYRERVQEAMS